MSARPDHLIAGVQRAHARLLDTVGRLDDEAARLPTLLPGWDVAMLVTHLARNADSHTWAAEGARAGESRRRYPDLAARDAGISAGRGRRAAELVADLSAACDRLERTWDTLPEAAWRVVAASATGEPEPMVALPRFRWREVEIHHADLGLGFTVADWDGELVAAELEWWAPGLGERLPSGTVALLRATDTGRSWRSGDGEATMLVEAPARSLLAWLTGRETAGFPEIGPWPW